MSRVAVAVGVIAVVALGLLVLWQSDQPADDFSVDPHGEGHGHDPMSDDPYVAVRMIASALYSYDPAEDETPLVQITQLQDRLTGEMTAVVEVPDDPQALDALYPPQWVSWKESGASVRGAVETVNYEQNVTSDRVTAQMHVQQNVYFVDGDTTPWRVFDIEMDMVWDQGVWKAEAFRVVAVDGGEHSHD